MPIPGFQVTRPCSRRQCRRQSPTPIPSHFNLIALNFTHVKSNGLRKMVSVFIASQSMTSLGIIRTLANLINSGASIGVGFWGMQERVRLIGGRLAVQSGDTGTSVTVTLPITWNNTESVSDREQQAAYPSIRSSKRLNSPARMMKRIGTPCHAR